MIGLPAVLAVAAALTWCARHYALRRNLLDQPGERRSHGVATPRGGGIAIVLTLLLAIAVAAILGPGLMNAMYAIAVVMLPHYARQTRA
ncbi:MAG: hypothetical protein ACREOX_08665, partial [Stenotrophomonas sp.]